MGHSVARPSSTSEDVKKIQRRLELLPEEALYLVERGAMYCWSPTDLPLPQSELLDDMEGVLSTCELVEGLSKDRLLPQFFLKRLPITRAHHISIFVFTIFCCALYGTTGASLELVSKM